ncbi:LysR family transcriptional regulator [Oxalicibacterium solurbis]|uniref:Transcriptional regulator n=1 Tax=Oxalicibacterium solurbis TaxID=69280 RepID=A0A8J3F9Q7_9BURK|nr:LysR family transcriptional regulator [Oxalicibacterium solurbis]GGI54903.1 transcriptional regulator [Oxalicibacterium solurbis]
MDIELARTFLCIVRSGSFIAAANRLHVTQTTVTARVQNLESQLGCSLFVRNRAGARLTDAGETFAGYASQLVQTWDAARRDLPLPDGIGNSISLGCEVSLCNPLVLQWTTRLHDELPTQAVRIEVGEGPTLQNKLEHGLLDAALVHRPEYWTGMQVEQLLEEKLIQVASTQNPEPYIYIDWGEAFRKAHDAALPEKARNAMSFNLGPLAFQYLLKNGGSGYFRTRVARRAIEKGLVAQVKNAPEFSYPVFLIYSRENKSEPLHKAFELLRDIVKDESDWAEHWDIAP